MYTQTELILFGAWTFLALVLTAASMATALSNHRSLGWRVRVLYLLTGLLILPLGFCAGAGWLVSWKWLLLPGCLFPPLCLVAAWLHLHALHESPFWARVLALPVMAVDLLLAATWALHLFHLVTGWDPGPHAMSLPLAGVLLQTAVGHPEAAFLPILVHLPLLIPPFREWRRITAWPLILMTAIPATGLLVVWGAHMPQAHRIALDCRAPLEKPVLRADQTLTLRHGPTDWNERFLQGRDEERQAVLASGARGVLLLASGEVAQDQEALARLKEEAAWARKEGLLVTLATLPATAWLTATPTLEALAGRMKELHWTLAVAVEPQVLVLWWEPVLLGAETLAAKPAPAQWAQAIAKSAVDLKTTAGGIRTSVCLGSPHLEGEEVFRALVAEAPALDEIGFSAVPYKRGLKGTQGFLARLDQIHGWIATSPKHKTFHILRTGTSPAPVGGEPGQARILAAALAWAANMKRIRGVCIHSLTNHTEDLGLITPLGRKREAFGLLPGKGE